MCKPHKLAKVYTELFLQRKINKFPFDSATGVRKKNRKRKKFKK